VDKYSVLCIDITGKIMLKGNKDVKLKKISFSRKTLLHGIS